MSAKGDRLAELFREGLRREPLLVQVDDLMDTALVAVPNESGRGLVLGMIDTAGDNAVLTLNRPAVQQLRDVLDGWLDR